MYVSRVVVEVDGSRDAFAALSWCARHATWGDEVVAVASLSLIGEAPLLVPPSDIRRWRDEVQDALEHVWTEPLRIRNVPYRTRVEDGTPWKMLLEVAREEKAEAIVVGYHRRALFPVGSTSDRVAHHSARPVIVVPRASEEHPPRPTPRLVTNQGPSE